MSADSPLDIARILEGSRLVVVGGTGFLGKVWLSMLLKRYPEVGKVLLVVRSKKGIDSEARFWADVAYSEPFAPLREDRTQAEYEAFLREKIEILDADVSKPLCGITNEQIERLSGTIDAVINVAGVVDFNPPLDEALLTNARGMEHLIELAKVLGNVGIHHTSTCYVAGYRSGRIPEVDPRELPFPRSEEITNAQWDPPREIREGLDLVRSIKRHADDAHRIAQFEEEALSNLERRQEPTQGPAFAAEVKKVRDKWIAAECEKAGMDRARFWGWTNTYTYTKSLGEQVLAASGLPFTIVRPAVIESSMSYPVAGWNEGINTMAPIMFMFMSGHMQIPASDKTSLDVIPVDMVSGGMIASLAALIEGTHQAVYQLGSSGTNALMISRLIEICGLYKRRHYQRTGKGNPWVNFVQAHWEPTGVSKEAFFAHGAPAISRAAKTLSQLSRKGAVGPLAAVLGPTSRALSSYAELAGRNGEIFSLFVPFMAETEYTFLTQGMTHLVARMNEVDRAKIMWWPEKIDWRYYMHEVHLPGLDKWVMPQIEEKLNRPLKPLKSYVSLVELIDEAAERREHRVALLYKERDGLARLTYAELRARVGGVARRLVDMGVAPGERVFLSASNHPDWAVAYFGILWAGAVAVPADASLDAAGLSNIVRASRSVAMIVDAKVAEKLAPQFNGAGPRRLDLHAVTAHDPSLEAPPMPQYASDALASVIYTSGTTGVPKGVMLTHGNFTAMLASLAPVFPLGEGDRMLSILPLHHTFEFTCGLLLPLSRGASVVYLDEITGAKVTGAMRDARVTAMVGVPALWQLLERRIWEQVRERGPMAETAFDMALALNRTLGRSVGANVGKVLFGSVYSKIGGNLKYLISGAAALPQDTAALFQGLGIPLAEGYGLTEAAPVLTVNKGTMSSKLGGVGSAVPGVELKIHNADGSGIGEVWARGPNVMQGYADNPEATAAVLDADGWLRTGDLGTLDKKGKLTLVGRSKDVVVSANGENVYPDDVERMLGQIDGIRELVVVGADDPRGGERVVLVVVPELDNVAPENRVSVRERALGRVRGRVKELPSALQPSVILPYDAELPRTASRKVKRSGVRPIVERLLAATAAPRVSREAGLSHEASAIRNAVASIARRDPATVTSASRLRADLGYDSLMAMELSVALEQIRGKGALPENILGIETVGELEASLGVDAARETPARRDPGATAVIEDEAEAKVSVPDPVKTLGRFALGVLQREFYGNMMKPKVTGRSFIPLNRPTLVVANHASHLDMGFVKYALGRYGQDLVALAAKDYFFDTKLKRAFSENFTNLAAFDREAGLHHTLEEVGALLRSGKTVLIFPEGTRSPDGSMQKFKGAVGFLALHHHIDILPVWLGGTYQALPKNRVIPTSREITARIGPVLSVEEIARLTHGMKPIHAARTVTQLAQRAVETLRDGGVLDLTTLKHADEDEPRRHPLVVLFDDLGRRFKPGQIESPMSFYFTLGDAPEAKWTVRVSQSDCNIVNQKPDGGIADCVLKTSPEIFTRIVREAYLPGVPEFMSGAVKSNDVGLLETFTRVFSLG